MRNFILVGAAIAALASTAATAQQAATAGAAAQPITRVEVTAKIDARFVRLDANRDWALT